MSLGLYVLMKGRFTKEMENTLDQFLKTKRFVKERLGSSFFYLYGGKGSIDVYISRTPMKSRGDYWREVSQDGSSLDFFPKADIYLESRDTRWSHLTSYSLAKTMAAMFGGSRLRPADVHGIRPQREAPAAVGSGRGFVPLRIPDRAVHECGGRTAAETSRGR